METISKEEYIEYKKLKDNKQKQAESVRRATKKYKQTHKDEPNFIDYQRRNAKKYYERHREEILAKYHSKKMGGDIYCLMQISV
jgi:hypothetical protein